MTKLDNSLYEALRDDYCGLGAVGQTAIASAWLDLAEGRCDDYIKVEGLTHQEFAETLLRLTTDIIKGGYLLCTRTPYGWEPEVEVIA